MFLNKEASTNSHTHKHTHHATASNSHHMIKLGILFILYIPFLNVICLQQWEEILFLWQGRLPQWPFAAGRLLTQLQTICHGHLAPSLCWPSVQFLKEKKKRGKNQCIDKIATLKPQQYLCYTFPSLFTYLSIFFSFYFIPCKAKFVFICLFY